MPSLHRLFLISLPTIVFSFVFLGLSSSPVFAACITAPSGFRNTGSGPVLCGDGAHACDSAQSCIDNGYVSQARAQAVDIGKAVTDLFQGAPETFCDTSSQTCNTAFGRVSYDIFKNSDDNFVNQVLRLAVGIGGGIALLLMLYGFFTITTSAGIPDKIKLGQETISSAALGLVFIILSTVLMNFIGFNILGLPGLQ